MVLLFLAACGTTPHQTKAADTAAPDTQVEASAPSDSAADDTADTGEDEFVCPDAGTTLTWDNFARGFFEEWCNNCHNPTDPGPGVPDDVEFQEESEVWALKDDILYRVVNSPQATAPPMPPEGDGYALDMDTRERAIQKGLDIAKIEEWLNCGTPTAE